MIFEHCTQFSGDSQAICDTLDSIFKTLSQEEILIIKQVYKKGLSREDAAVALGISAQELAIRETNLLAKLCYSKNSIRLEKFSAN